MSSDRRWYEREIDMTADLADYDLADAVHASDPTFEAAYYAVLVHESGERALVVAVTCESYRVDRPEYRVDSIHLTQSAVLTRLLELVAGHVVTSESNTRSRAPGSCTVVGRVRRRLALRGSDDRVSQPV